MSTRAARFATGARVIVRRGNFRPAIGRHGTITAVQWSETTYAAGYVYTVELDEPLIDPSNGRSANGFLFNEGDLEATV